MKASVRIAIAAVFALASLGANAAVDSSQSIAVSTTVANKCVVASGATLTFPNYDPVVTNLATDLAGTGSFQVKCTKGATGVFVNLGLGNNTAVASTLPRRMTDGAGTPSFLVYHLYQPTGTNLDTCGGTTVWDDTTAGKLTVGSTFWTTGTANKTISVCGVIPQAQDVPAGTYNDTVVISVNF
jgi:spore coat protein U-like protein